MRTRAPFLGVALLSLLTGCVERRFVVESDPPGAIVYVNNSSMGATPVDVPFLYYGVYDLTLVRDGCETLRVRQNVQPPLYAYPPLDFAAENLYPFHIEDVRRFRYQLRPVRIPQTDELLRQATDLRERGQQLGQPTPVRDPGGLPTSVP
jgi:hypothetical protein